MSETESKEEYDLKPNSKVGALYPVLRAKDGTLIDGFHRLSENPNWPQMKLDNIDDEEKILLARPIANWHRRQVSKEEKSEWMNKLAEYYMRQGLRTQAPNPDPTNPQPVNEIKERITRELGVSGSTVLNYLDSKYKQAQDSLVPRKALTSTKRTQTQMKERREALKDPRFLEQAIETVGEMTPDARDSVNALLAAIKPRAKEFAEALKKSHAHGNLQDNRRFMAGILTSIQSGDIYCPDHQNGGGTLHWSCCGKPLKKAVDEIMEKLYHEDQQSG